MEKFNCVKCGQVEVLEEFTRCEPCEADHKALCAKLDSQPKSEPAPKRQMRSMPANVPGGVVYFMD